MDNSTKKTIEYERFIAMLRTTKRAGKLVSTETALKISGCEPDHFYHAVRRSMETDLAAGRPFIVSFLVGKNNQPIPQYFQYAKELGIDIQNPNGWWQGQLAKLGVPNVSNVIRTINAGGKHPHQKNGHQPNINGTFSEATESFYGKQNLSVYGSTPTPTNRTRGNRGGRGRSRSTETVVRETVI